MSAYDDITADELRSRLTSFARLVLKLEERGELLDRLPALMKLLGELRRMLFAYEVRCTGKLVPAEPDPDHEAEDPGVDQEITDSLRIVEEALERERELQDELRDRLFPDDAD